MSDRQAPYLGRQPESDLQAEICQWLKLAVPKALVFQFAKPRSRPKCARCGAVVGALAGGVPVGWFDLLLIVGGGGTPPPPRYIHVEVKTGSGRLSADQQELAIDLKNMGVSWVVVWSLADLADYLWAEGIPLRLEAP